jgi:GABA(A) receptor-associated protein
MRTIKFQNKYTHEQRKQESDKILIKYPDRLPFIVELDNQFGIIDGYKSKYLVPKDLTMGQFTYVIRKKIKLSPNKALFLFNNNKIPSTESRMIDIYEENKNEDGFAYFMVTQENTFGL